MFDNFLPNLFELDNSPNDTNTFFVRRSEDSFSQEDKLMTTIKCYEK